MRKALRGLVGRDRNRPTESSPSQKLAVPPSATAQPDTSTPASSRPASVPAPSPSPAPDEEVPHDISEDLWAKAYDILAEREPDLISDYERHLAATQDGQDAAADRRAALSNPEAVKEVVQSLQDNRKAKQWKFSIRSKDHKVKDQLEKLVKLVSLADGIIKNAVSAQPYAALAWSAVSVFLPVCFIMKSPRIYLNC